jgi:hypothetical protein
MDCMFPVFVRRIGDNWVRYVLKDAIGQIWTGKGWGSKLSEALLFHSELDAIETRNRLDFNGDDEADTFITQVVLTVHRGKWTMDELIAHMRRHRSSYLNGPPGKGGILLEILPTELRKVEAPGETQ